MKNKIAFGLLGQRINDLYVFDHHQIKTTLAYDYLVFPSSLSCQTSVFSFTFNNQTMLWHNRLGHISVAKLKDLSLVSSKCTDLNLESCVVCSKAKQRKLPFPVSKSMSKASFDLIHVDVWGPYKHMTHDGFKYFITIVDDHSRYTWIHLLSHKYYSFTLLKDFVKMVKTQFNTMVKVIRTDNALELGSSTEGVNFFPRQWYFASKVHSL